MHAIFADYSTSDPRAALHAMTAQPVSREPSTGALLVTSYQLVQELLLHPALTNMAQRDPLADADLTAQQVELHRPVLRFFQAWGHHHTMVRDRLRPAFSRSACAPILHQLALDCAELLEQLSTESVPVDWIDRFCRPYALRLLAALFGATSAQLDTLAGATEGLMAYLAKPRAHLDDEVGGRARESLTMAQAAVRDTVLAEPTAPLALALREIADDTGLGEQTAVAVAVQIITGTLDPLAAALAEAAQRYQSSAAARPYRAAADEALRLSCPFRFAVRYATEEFRIAGHTVLPGQRVLLVLGSANLDEEVFPDPLAFLPGREARPLSFGWGVHHCVGATLARGALDILARTLDEGGRTLEVVPGSLRRVGHLGADQITALMVRVG
ncbi:cytochrome P450 [Kitasatospora acidiphila]|uniref:Cytochrome P450 n=1 Tax=Kitasatospora acidiphila TaxID=2567942 RepID=A0A540WG55_9ACTN|nr:cytochrome P450 [Kitasatospora acidiphila]TQF08010.1 cytochrome P450 [Kitasatospora acidiphila]